MHLVPNQQLIKPLVEYEIATIMQIFPSNKSDHPVSDRKDLHTDPNYKMLF
jgi:hypothetical protein